MLQTHNVSISKKDETVGQTEQTAIPEMEHASTLAQVDQRALQVEVAPEADEG